MENQFIGILASFLITLWKIHESKVTKDSKQKIVFILENPTFLYGYILSLIREGLLIFCKFISEFIFIEISLFSFFEKIEKPNIWNGAISVVST